MYEEHEQVCILFKTLFQLFRRVQNFTRGGKGVATVCGEWVQHLTQSGTTKGLFLCFQITIEVKPDPGNQSRFPEINPRAARTLSMKRN